MMRYSDSSSLDESFQMDVSMSTVNSSDLCIVGTKNRIFSLAAKDVI